MVFSSIEFLWFFMPVVLGLYFLVPPRRRNLLLALASLVFYAWGAHAIVLVFLASITINYTAGRLIGRYREQDRDGGRTARDDRRGGRRSGDPVRLEVHGVRGQPGVVDPRGGR